MAFCAPVQAPLPPRRPREEFPLTWYVTCGMPAYAALAGVRFDRIFTELDAMVEAFTVGEPRARELFGPDVRYGGPGWAGISYGHVNCLGAPLTFPEDSEVGVAPIYPSLDEGIAALEKKTEWSRAGLMPFYLQLWAELKKAFPDRVIPFGGFGLEGPITTAWELRGHDCFTDPFEEPERYRVFMELVTASIVDFSVFLRELNGEPSRVSDGVFMCDDLSSLFGPRDWPEWVLPWQDQYFRSQSDGPRRAHIENLIPAHLPMLDALGLEMFDPGVSPRLSGADLRDRFAGCFHWRLNSMQLRDFTPEQVRRYVRAGAAAGASCVFVNILRDTLAPEIVAKIHVFMETAREVAIPDDRR